MIVGLLSVGFKLFLDGVFVLGVDDVFGFECYDFEIGELKHSL